MGKQCPNCGKELKDNANTNDFIFEFTPTK